MHAQNESCYIRKSMCGASANGKEENVLREHIEFRIVRTKNFALKYKEKLGMRKCIWKRARTETPRVQVYSVEYIGAYRESERYYLFSTIDDVHWMWHVERQKPCTIAMTKWMYAILNERNASTELFEFNDVCTFYWFSCEK